jgi:hypothetical protein
MINAYDEHFDWVNDLLVLKKHDKCIDSFYYSHILKLYHAPMMEPLKYGI